ncbi:MAG: HAMP domain-containing protein, partial [Thermoguttaceae bacterium]
MRFSLRNAKLRTKMVGGFLVVVALTFVGSGVAYWGMQQMDTAANEAVQRAKDANVALEASLYSVKLYQNQADLIINRDLSLIDEFQKKADYMEGLHRQLGEIVDTPEEQAWLAELDAADVAFGKVFHEGIVPEVQHQLKELIRQYDGESDVLIAQAEEAGVKIVESIQKELEEAIAKSDDKELKLRVEQVIAAQNMMYWMIKQYQNQADLIINQDVQSVEDFKQSMAMMDHYKELVAKAVDTDLERSLLAEIDKADEAYDALFFGKVLPEVERIIENRIATLDGQSDEHLAIIGERIDKIVASLNEEVEEAQGEFATNKTLAINVLLGFAIFSGFAGLLLGLWIARMITRPVGETLDVLKSVANGDYSEKVGYDSEDEVGQMATALNTTIDAVAQAMQEVKDAADREKEAQAKKAEEDRRRAEAQRQEAEEGERKVKHILEVAEKVADRDYSMEVTVSGDDALGQLGEGLKDFFGNKKRLEEEADKAARIEQEQAEELRRKVDGLLEVVAAAADGDLTREIHVVGDEPVDELAAGLKKMLTDLSGVISQVTESAAQFNEGSRVIAESSQSLASGAQTQSSSVEEVSASVEELNASIDGVKTNASEADAVAKKTNDLAERGGQAVQKSLEAMELIRTSSDQIAEIIQVISEIASQTNLLALNAAIEA